MSKTLEKPSILCAAAVWFAVFVCLNACAHAENRIDLSKYKLTFSDEFDKMDISRAGPNTKWTAHTPWGGDFGDATFKDPGPSGPFRIENGKLLITASRDTEGRWSSGLISSVDKSGNGFAQKYGYFEIRAKLPPGKGLWPAFWLNTYNSDGPHSAGIEVDVFEHYGQFPAGFRVQIHIWPKPENDERDKERGHVVDMPAGSLYNEYHTYGVDVSPEYIRIYLDGVEKWSYPTPSEHKGRLAVLSNLALGGGWPIEDAPSPSTMYIDYIRAYERK